MFKLRPWQAHLVLCVFQELLFEADSLNMSQWFAANASIPWGRTASMVALSDGALVAAGGNTPDRKVWMSVNLGRSWTCQTADAPWNHRIGNCLVVNSSNNDIWLLGGKDGNSYPQDVWISSDSGITWVQKGATFPFAGRWYMSCALVDNNAALLVLAGGRGIGTFYSDGWKTRDGIIWTQLTSALPWGKRQWGFTTTTSDGSIVFGAGQSASKSFRKDVWLSNDQGHTWSSQTSTASWRHRVGAQSLYFNGSIYLVGGHTIAGWQRDVWRSEDLGVTWQLVVDPAAFPSEEPSVVLNKDVAVLLASRSVWTTQDVATSATTTTTTSIAATAVTTLNSTNTTVNTTSQTTATTAASTPVSSTTSARTTTSSRNPALPTDPCNRNCYASRNQVSAVRSALASTAVQDGQPVVRSVTLGNYTVQVAVQKLSDSALASGVRLSSGTTSLNLPGSISNQISGTVVLSLISWNGTQALDGGSGVAQGADLGWQPVEVEITQNSTPLSISGLAEPIKIETLIANNTPPSTDLKLTCVYWDTTAERWSREGVRTVLHPGTNVLTCESSHLSVFAALWSSALMGVTCSNLAIFTENGFELLAGKQVPGMQRWFEHSAGIVIIVLLTANFLLMVGTLILDALERRRKWNDYDFFLESHDPKITRTAKSCLEDLFMSKVVLAHAAAHAHVSKDDMWFAVQQRKMMVHAYRKSHIDAEKARTTRRHLRSASLVLHKHGVTTESGTIHELIKDATSKGSANKIWNFFMNQHPLLQVLRFSVMYSRFFRLLFISCTLWGSLMGSCLFFSTSGSTSLEDPAACAAASIPIVKAAVSGIASLVVSQLATILVSVLDQRQFVLASTWEEQKKKKTIRVWKTCHIVQNILLLQYFFFSVLFVLLFLANVTNIDRASFIVSAVVSLVLAWFLTPIVTTIVLICMTNLRPVHKVKHNWAERALDQQGKLDSVIWGSEKSVQDENMKRSGSHLEEAMPYQEGKIALPRESITITDITDTLTEHL